MAAPQVETETFTPGERAIYDRLGNLSDRLGEIEALLERYRPMLAQAEARMTGPRIFGRGAARVTPSENRRQA